MKSYVVGFAFLKNWNGPTSVVLIRKAKPEWQRGKLNGVGGKIEDGECCNVAMAREFKEETGCDTFPTDWTQFTRMNFGTTVVYCFATHLPSHKEVNTTTEEEVVVLPVVDAQREEIIPNLRWLIPMALYSVWPKREDGFLPTVLKHE